MFGTSLDELYGSECSFDMFRCVCLPVLEELQLGKMQTKLQLKSVRCGLHYGWNLCLFFRWQTWPVPCPVTKMGWSLYAWLQQRLMPCAHRYATCKPWLYADLSHSEEKCIHWVCLFSGMFFLQLAWLWNKTLKRNKLLNSAVNLLWYYQWWEIFLWHFLLRMSHIYILWGLVFWCLQL